MTGSRISLPKGDAVHWRDLSDQTRNEGGALACQGLPSKICSVADSRVFRAIESSIWGEENCSTTGGGAESGKHKGQCKPLGLLLRNASSWKTIAAPEAEHTTSIETGFNSGDATAMPKDSTSHEMTRRPRKRALRRVCIAQLSVKALPEITRKIWHHSPRNWASET